MKKSFLAVAIAAAVMIAGCEQEPTFEDQQKYVDEQAQKQARAQLSADETELKLALAQMQSVDPTIIDAYYGVDAQGNRVLHVIHKNQAVASPVSEQTGGASVVASNGVSDMIWPMVGGMAAGALAANIMSSGGLSGFASHTPPAATKSYSEEDRRKERNGAVSGYAGSVMNMSRARVVSNPNFKSNMRSSISSRSSGVFSSSSSARAGGYSAGA